MGKEIYAFEKAELVDRYIGDLRGYARPVGNSLVA
jgi:hypothetical protein